MPRMFEAADCAKARLRPPVFGLTDKAMKFAKLYAEEPMLGPTNCARQAGYSDKGGAASVRGAELQRDPRVQRAVIHFGRLAFGAAQAEAIAHLRLYCQLNEDSVSPRRMRYLLAELHRLEESGERLDRVYYALAATAWYAGPLGV
jgi:hypothetical protein